MKIFWIFLGIFLSLFAWTIPTVTANTDGNTDVIQNLHTDIKGSNTKNATLNTFTENTWGYFYKNSSDNTEDAVGNIFFQIAKWIKNTFLYIAVCFLVFSVIKLFFSDASDDDVKKWKNSIVWTSIGIVFLQMSYSIWSTAMSLDNIQYGQNPLSAATAWKFWNNIFSPLIGLLQFLASFAFFAVMIYAFYIIVTGAWDEDKLKKWKNTLIFGVVGFVMIQLPYRIVTSLYQGLPDCKENEGLWGLANTGCSGVSNGEFTETVQLFANIITYFNRFLTVLCIIMAIYAGWLLFISGGEEEKVKKAKNIIIYICIGLILLVASHAIFRFFILQDMPR